MFEIYRNTFLEENTSRWWGEETISRAWDEVTIYFYFAIVLFSMIIGWQIEIIKSKKICDTTSAKFKFKKRRSLRYRLYLFFLILIIILGCRHYSVGIDTIVYRNTIDNAVSLKQIFEDSTSEPFYKILQYLIHLTIGSGTIGIFLYAVATLMLVCKGFKNNLGNINVYLALLVYTCIYFFPAMNLMRLSLAASFVFANFHYLIDGRYKMFLLIICFACMMHYSTAVLLIPLAMYLIYQRNRKLAFFFIIILTLIVLFGVTILGDYISILNRYAGYIEGNESSGRVGVMLFFDYLPALFVLYYIYKHKINGRWSDLTVCFTSAALLVRLLAYFITAAGRLHVHFMFLTLILIPYWAYYQKMRNIKDYKMYLCLCTIWALFRLHIYFTGYLVADGIMPYKFAF